MKRCDLIRRFAVVSLAGVALSGCGRETPPAEPSPQTNPFAGLPFVLVPDKDGNLQPRTADGKPLEPREGPPGDGIKAIRNLGQAVVITIEGSCYHWVYVNGHWYRVPC
ncbi:MAG TPA: hypothetical protein DCZ11_11695 [Gammaproteobacteria bacterium]|uniref:hypothetical protein n=1 Tax=Immundisolibacter sp. TaxID=1934948 RepID=UPI000E94F7E2|nr:hypothetical protein [Gammaproteobacteria bacterium]HCZ49654.1 hypothetical protein [Gammaproteobacteria bacterium]MCH79092.1 hypothetical protein [Gammaproteobacteria bacterium]